MLTDTERQQRYEFYVEKLGSKKVEALLQHNPYLWSVQNYHDHVIFFEELGCGDPQKIFHWCPMVIGLLPTTLTKKVTALEQRWFEKVPTLIHRFPQILIISLDTIDEKMAWFEKRGFEDLPKVIFRYPRILGYSVHTLDRKIREIGNLGFPDIVRVISLCPTILGLSINTIRKRIINFEREGLGDGVQLIHRFPRAVSQSCEYVSYKVRLCRHLKVDIDAFLASGYASFLICLSAKRYIPLVRTIKREGWDFTPRAVQKAYLLRE